jgi:hypothetical protein
MSGRVKKEPTIGRALAKIAETSSSTASEATTAAGFRSSIALWCEDLVPITLVKTREILYLSGNRNSGVGRIANKKLSDAW